MRNRVEMLDQLIGQTVTKPFIAHFHHCRRAGADLQQTVGHLLGQRLALFGAVQFTAEQIGSKGGTIGLIVTVVFEIDRGRMAFRPIPQTDRFRAPASAIRNVLELKERIFAQRVDHHGSERLPVGIGLGDHIQHPLFSHLFGKGIIAQQKRDQMAAGPRSDLGTLWRSRYQDARLLIGRLRIGNRQRRNGTRLSRPADVPQGAQFGMLLRNIRQPRRHLRRRVPVPVRQVERLSRVHPNRRPETPVVVRSGQHRSVSAIPDVPPLRPHIGLVVAGMVDVLNIELQRSGRA